MNDKIVDKYWLMYHRTQKFDALLSSLGLSYAKGKWIFYSYGKNCKFSSGCGAEIIGTTIHHDSKFLVLRNKIKGNNIIGQYGTLIEVPYKHLNRIRMITEDEMDTWNCRDVALKQTDFDLWGITPRPSLAKLIANAKKQITDNGCV